MTDSVVSFVVERVGNLLLEEGKFLYGVEDQVLDLHTELLRMQCFLEDADAMQDRNKRVSNWIAEIRELAYKGEDVLETFICRVAARRRGGLRPILARIACILGEFVILHKVGSEIETIKIKITNLTARLQTYGLRDLARAEGFPAAHERRQQLRRTYSHVREEDFVGYGEDVESLVVDLVRSDDDRSRIVAIWGMGGQGKTTVARKVYHHAEVRRRFDGFAWACITQQWKKDEVLKGILVSLTPERKEDIAKMRDAELVKGLCEIQERKKCLVVLDDVWSSDLWEIIRSAFPIEKTKSKILLTTRYNFVPGEMDPSAVLHELKRLDEEESWDLFQKKALSRRDNSDPTMDAKMELGQELVKHCQGLPLAIVVLGGLLATKSTLPEWQAVYRSFLTRGKAHGGGQDGRVLEVLALSYYDLPYRLKPCFLYLANFSGNFDVNTQKLYQLWLAEGIVSMLEDDERDGEETMMEVAERYLGELAERCMVQVQMEEDYFANNGSSACRRFKSCRLHDLMRDLCLSKVREENFLTIFDFRQKNIRQGSSSSSSMPASMPARPDKMHRLAVYLDRHMERELPLKQGKNLRSVLLFYSGYSGSWSFWKQIKSQFSNSFKLVRVLDLQGITYVIRKLPRTVGRLIHLRYLSIRFTEFTALPSSIGQLRYLETLDLRTRSQLIIPNVIWKMAKLRHLHLPAHFLSKRSKLRLQGLDCLETLENFDAKGCNVKDLIKLTNLRMLISASIWHNQEDLAWIIKYLRTINPEQRPLRHAYIAIREFRFCSNEEHTMLRDLLCCQHLNILEISGTMKEFPDFHHFSPNLTELWLADSNLEKDPIPVLERLPNLRKTALICNAFVGAKMVCSAGGFCQLRYLELKELHSLREWRVEEGAMPILSSLKIQGCGMLKMIPEGLKFITTLQDLKIWSMPELFLNRVRVLKGRKGEKEGEDLYKICHVPSINLGH